MFRLLFLSLLAITPTLASQDTIFNHRVVDRNYLNYYTIWNQFDGSAVMYEFGEVAIIHGGTKQRIPLSGFVKNGEKIQGSGAQGISTDIQSLARTEDFNLPVGTGGDVEYFGRIQSFRTPCDEHLGAGDTANGEGPNRPISNWGILDRTEFVIQLVRSADNLVIATFDSLGVHPTGTTPPAVDTRYGDFNTVVHSYQVPPGYGGEKVYIRVSPRRYGPTPLGLTISKYRTWVNITAELELTSTQAQQLRVKWFTDWLAYCDSVKAETGWLPDIKGVAFIGNEYDTFNNRYFNKETNPTTGESIWRERHTLTSSKRGVLSAQGSGTVRMAPSATIRSITPNPVATPETELFIACIVETSARIRLISVTGEDAGILWNGHLQVGKCNLPVQIPKSTANGAYILVLENEAGQQMYQKSVVVAR